MTTYKEIKGTQIEVLESDPSNPVEGQVWYNSTSNVLKGQSVTTAGAWATGTSVNTARSALGSAVQAPVSTAMIYGGNNPGGAVEGEVEQYNGSNWTEITDINTARGSGSGGGTNTAALYSGGYLGPPGDTGIVESWNGSSWTEVADLNTGRYVTGGGVGSNTANLIAGGITTPPFAVRSEAEQWNGSAWTEVADLNTARYGTGAAGATYTSAIFAGGTAGPPNYALTEQWNGTNWTEVGDLNTARATIGSGGTTTSAIVFGGGGEPRSADTELWDGTSWTETSNLNTGRADVGDGGGTGSTSSAIAAAGSGNSAPTTAVEEWTGAGAASTRTFTDS